MRYVLFYKPFEVMCSFTDPQGRKTLKDLVAVEGVYPAGRLDYDSEGLLLLTDDGEAIHRITDPRFDHPKTYLVQVEGVATDDAVRRLRDGVRLRERRSKQDCLTRPTDVEIVTNPAVPFRRVRDYHPTTWLRVVLREGKRRQLRRMTAVVGLPALRLIRVGIGPLTLGDLKPGDWRPLSVDEERALLQSLGLATGWL